MKSLQTWIVFIVIFLTFICVWGWHRQNDAKEDAPAGDASDDTATTRSAPREAHDLIRNAAAAYDVPAGILYGIWQRESGLSEGKGTGKGRSHAGELVKDGGPCAKRYGKAYCAKQWDSLRSICSQRKPDGAAVCDPLTVETSSDLAMGPLRILPAEIVSVAPDGKASWSAFKTDFDGDGTVDPMSFADAIGMAAKIVRKRFEESKAAAGDAKAWIRAAERFCAERAATSSGGPSIQDRWQQWYKMNGKGSVAPAER